MRKALGWAAVATVIIVEVLDVTDEEARKLLLSIDPMAQLAGYNDELLGRLRSSVETRSDALSNLWASVADGQRAAEKAMNEARRKAARDEAPAPQDLPDKYLVIVECDGERHQADALRRCKEQGLECKAVMSRWRHGCDNPAAHSTHRRSREN